jgi:TolB-like protein/Flp pilus assembly protein TadD
MSSFFTELKRRNVFKVGVAYAIVAWLAIQIVNNFFPLLGLPEWSQTLIAVCILIGFPFALLFAWAFELTPEGIKPSKSVEPAESITRDTGQKLNYVITGVMALAIIFLIVDNYVLVEEVLVMEPELPANTTKTVEDIAETKPTAIINEPERLANSVAILPFANLSPNPDNAYFAAGIHESTLNQLAKIRDISVIARTSVMQYENDPPPIPEIAETLNVEMVMEGSVRYANDLVLITAQLIDGITGTHVWSEEYERDLTDIFGIQAEIAENIAMALKAEILPREKQRIQMMQTKSPAAYALYLKASDLRPTGGGVGPIDDLHRLLDQAIELDPGFARAHALKAYDYSLAIGRSRRPEDPQLNELERLAIEHAEYALALDPDENLAYQVLARIHLFNRRVPESESAFEKAMELAPNDPLSLLGFSSFLKYLEEYDRAIELALRTYELDPSRSAHGRAYMAEGNFEAAYTAWDDLIRNYPTNSYHYQMQAITEWHRGNEETALENFQIAESLSGNAPGDIVRNIEVSGLINRKEDVLRLFRILEKMAETYHISVGDWAKVYLGIGEYEQALTMLRRIDEEQSPEDAFDGFNLAINHYHNPVLERPEFIEIREKLKLKR